MLSLKAIPLALAPLLTFLSGIAADDDTSQWPDWVTNDYDCVIECLSGFNDTITSVPQDAMAQAALSCSSSTCTGDSTGNYYQTLYYIQLFYATGSIYEWVDSAPDGYQGATFTSTTGAVVSGDATYSETDSASATDSATDSSSDSTSDSGEEATTVSAAADMAVSTTNTSDSSGTASSSASSSSSTVASDISEGAAGRVSVPGGMVSMGAAVGAVVLGGVWTAM